MPLSLPSGSDSGTDQGQPLARRGHSPARRAGLGTLGRTATPRRPPARSRQRRYGDCAVAVPCDAAPVQVHPAAFRRPNPPHLASVGPDHPAVISRSEGRRPQAVIARSSLEHPVTIHFVVGSNSRTCRSFSPTADSLAGERGDGTGAGDGIRWRAARRSARPLRTRRVRDSSPVAARARARPC